MGTRKCLGAITVALSVVGVSTAFGAGLKTESETITVDFDHPAATPECAHGKSISGGFAAEDADVTLYRSAKAGAKGWTVEALSEDGATDLTVFAYCAKKQKSPTTVSETTTLEGGEIGTLTATCDEGTKAVSGGFAGEHGFLLAPSIIAHESRKSGGRTWRVTAVNYGLVEGELAAYVNCRNGKGLRAKSKSATIAGDASEANPTGSVAAKCKRGRRAVSGGFAGQVDPSFVTAPPDGVAIHTYASHRDGGRRWVTAAANLGDSAGELTTYVYCEKKPKRK
jgi:hypothetical protein